LATPAFWVEGAPSSPPPILFPKKLFGGAEEGFARQRLYYGLLPLRQAAMTAPSHGKMTAFFEMTVGHERQV
jgi:hypothetical protein